MPCSAKQLAANRRNAQKSTGPRTPAGKAISSQNATKHGLYSKSRFLDTPALNEDRGEYLSLADAIVAELHPVGLAQFALVRRIARCLWLQKRTMEAENRFLESSCTSMTYPDVDEVAVMMSRFTRDLLAREHANDRILSESLDQLRRLRTLHRAPKKRKNAKMTTTNPFQKHCCNS